MDGKSSRHLGLSGEFQSAIVYRWRDDPMVGNEIELARGWFQVRSVAALAGFGSKPLAKIGEHMTRLVTAFFSAWLGPIVNVQPVAANACVAAEFSHQEFRANLSQFGHVGFPFPNFP
ncbi:hypothetical protein [Mesorhizobium sp. B2-5-13]|uniref:hypothetical protein n=1 Tax=Mesorhizobium sp. B2-5-13 TaxID=2589917 RepID=UPI0015E3746E|nr:hypothetical protein [Mesorhizobium sp. B2-5-13]